MLMALVLGLGWEMIEMDTGFLQGQYGEPWQNRWVSDPIFDLLGAYIGMFLGTLLSRKHDVDSI